MSEINELIKQHMEVLGYKYFKGRQNLVFVSRYNPYNLDKTNKELAEEIGINASIFDNILSQVNKKLSFELKFTLPESQTNQTFDFCRNKLIDNYQKHKATYKRSIPRTKQRREVQDDLYFPSRRSNLIAYQIQCACCKEGWFYFEREFCMTNGGNSYHKLFSFLEIGLKDIKILTLNWNGEITEHELEFIKRDAIESALKFAINYMKDFKRDYETDPKFIFVIEEIASFLIQKYDVQTDRRTPALERRVDVN